MSSIVVGQCADCSRDLVPQRRWGSFPVAYRAALRVHRFGIHQGRGLCDHCFQRRRRNGDLIDVERKTLSRDELLDEWHHFVKDRDTYTQNVRSFAAYLGRDYRAIEKALTRAGIRAHGQKAA